MNKSDRPGLYLHVPFCRSKCPYCDFYSLASLSLSSAWVEAVEREAKLYAGEYPAFDSIYLGGGTPTLLDDRQTARIMDCFDRCFGLSNDAEVTIEANPDDITAEKLKLLKSLGFNRISVGAQSFDDGELRFLGRRHTAAQTERALALIRETGFDNLGLDLIYGFNTGASPHASCERNWKRNLERALQFQPEHLSCYQMTYEAGTLFGRMKAKGKIEASSEETESDLFLFTSQFLEEHGYLHYEISNFAKDPAHTSRHNQKYWSHVPYLGLGPAAHSFKNGRRWWNVKSVRKYCALTNEGKVPVEESELLFDEQLKLETLYLGLRTREGIDLDAVRDTPGYESAINELERSGLARVCGQKLSPTTKGFLVADSLPLMFL